MCADRRFVIGQKSQSPVCLFGAGGHGRVLAHQLHQRARQACDFGDANRTIGDLLDGFNVVATTVKHLSGRDILITIGDGKIREDLQNSAVQAGANPVSVVLQPEQFFGADIGAGCQILTGAIVNPAAHLGEGVIVNSNAVVEHDCTIRSFAHVAPGAVMGGGSQLGYRSFLGTNATLLPGCTVCDHVVIGAGAVVTADITTPGSYVGAPARRISPSPTS